MRVTDWFGNRSCENNERNYRFEMPAADHKVTSREGGVTASPRTTQATLIRFNLATGQESSAIKKDTTPFVGLNDLLIRAL